MCRGLLEGPCSQLQKEAWSVVACFPVSFKLLHAARLQVLCYWDHNQQAKQSRHKQKPSKQVVCSDCHQSAHPSPPRLLPVDPTETLQHQTSLPACALFSCSGSDRLGRLVGQPMECHGRAHLASVGEGGTSQTCRGPKQGYWL